jgi:hypothetical protein
MAYWHILAVLMAHPSAHAGMAQPEAISDSVRVV